MPLLATLLAIFAAASPAVPQGYVDDASCTPCHANVVKTFQHVGMAQAFHRPRQNESIEDFAKLPFRHAKSGDVMELRWRDGKLIFRRWQLDAAGHPTHAFQTPVDYILGSGNHARTYLYQTPNGELYQLPLAWYSQTEDWGMAPGYDRPDHDGVLRRARTECLFCHNAYAELPKNATTGYWRNQTFPVQPPEGIGCQRCHGPGAAHVSKAWSNADDAEVRAAIVNPAKLEPALRNDVCYECHLQPSVAFPGVRRLGRDIESFRPGEPLPSYMLHLNIADADIASGERFEINHHPFRLEQSRCFRESGGKLSCLTCHDPHKKVVDVSATCKSCHAAAHHASENCATCHMPKRRTQDVVRVVMTDHRIGIYRDLASLVSPREERDPMIDDITITDGARAPADAELYRVVAALRGGASSAAPRLEALLAAKPAATVEPYIDLANAQLRQKRFAEAEATARSIVSRAPDQAIGLELLALARSNQGFRDEAVDLLRRAVALDPTRVETQYALGAQLAARGDRDEAATWFEKAIAARPNFVAAWIQLGNVRNDRDAKVAAYERALELDPRSKAAAKALAAVKP